MERDSDTRGRGMPRPRAHADFGAPEILGFRDNGVPEGQIVPDDIPEVGQREIQVPEPGILVPGVLRRHGGQEREEDRGIHPKSAEGGPDGRPADDRLRRRSVQRIASVRCRRWSVPRPRSAAAGDRGLKCPKLKNHRFDRWIVIFGIQNPTKPALMTFSRM